MGEGGTQEGADVAPAPGAEAHLGGGAMGDQGAQRPGIGGQSVERAAEPSGKGGEGRCDITAAPLGEVWVGEDLLAQRGEGLRGKGTGSGQDVMRRLLCARKYIIRYS